MRVYDLGSTYRVVVLTREVEAFRDRWPCSGLGHYAITFEFDKRNGDLVDCRHRGSEDGPALVALSHDAQTAGKKMLNLS